MLKQLTRDILHLKERAVHNWENAQRDNKWGHMNRYTYWQKRVNEKYLQIATERLIEILKPLKPDDFYTDEVQHQLESFFMNAILQCPFLLDAEKNYLCNSTQLTASRQFIEQFLKEDSNLTVENLGQAVRNFWIANLLQVCFSKPVENAEALYGYSMLYPYTDNLMDSLTSDKSEKLGFCKRLTAKLLGESPKSASDNEARIFELVDKIYCQYPIETYPTVQMGLLAIHDAQAESLKQQQDYLMPYEIDLLGKSFHKGGTSLIADGFLVKPDMSEAEQDFCFGFGAILQLCDDLQDIESDILSNHYTLFSQLKGRYALDPLVEKLNGYLDKLMSELNEIRQPSEYDISLVIARNTRLLLLYAILDNERAFTKPFIQNANEFLPIRPSSLRKIARKLKSETKQMTLFQKLPKKTALSDLSIEQLKNDLTHIS